MIVCEVLEFHFLNFEFQKTVKLFAMRVRYVTPTHHRVVYLLPEKKRRMRGKDSFIILILKVIKGL